VALDWTQLPGWLLDSDAQAWADPNLRIADGTRFIHHVAAPPDAALTVSVSVQLVEGATRPVLPGMVVPPAYPPAGRFFTARVDRASLNALLIHPDVVRVQLSEGLVPQRPRSQAATPWPRAELPPSTATPGTGTPLLLGVIDSGCPFAHADLRRPGGGGTRVVRLWNQDGGLGVMPTTTMGYGAELHDGDLNTLMARASDAACRVDEHACYLMAGAAPLLGRTSHGAHALGLLAGRRQFNARPNRDGAPPLQIATDEAANADIAFVQLPQKLLDVPFPPAMEHHLLDALRYLLAVGRDRSAQRIVVSIGYESWLGPHDDSSWFGQAVQTLIAEAGDAGSTLSVCVIAGNSGDIGVHRLLADDIPPPADGLPWQATVHWQLPPGGEAPTQMELWVPFGSEGFQNLRLQITPPGQDSLPDLPWGDAVAWPDAISPALCVVMDAQSRTLGTKAAVIVLRFSPTQADGRHGRAAPHGEWKLTLRSTQSLAGIHAYIGRGTASMNSPRRGRQAWFTRRNGDDKLQDRSGTLNAHGSQPDLPNRSGMLVTTASVSRETVYCGPHSKLQPGQAASYGGAGPTRDGARQGPSFGVTVEHGTYHHGHIGIGNRSGTTLRLSGTSVSAPLGARLHLGAAAPDAAAAVAVAAAAAALMLADYPQQAQELGTLLHEPP